MRQLTIPWGNKLKFGDLWIYHYFFFIKSNGHCIYTAPSSYQTMSLEEVCAKFDAPTVTINLVANIGEQVMLHRNNKVIPGIVTQIEVAGPTVIWYEISYLYNGCTLKSWCDSMDFIPCN